MSDLASRMYPPAAAAPPPAVAAPSPSPPAPSAPATSATDGDDLRTAADPPTDSTPPARPETADGYKAELPADFKVPDGVKMTEIGAIDASDPRVASARGFAHKHNMSQEQFSGMLALYAESIISDVKAYNSRIEAEGKKLGPNASQRGASIKSWLAAKLGADRANDLTARFNRAADIEAFEKLRDARAPAQTLEQRWYGTR